MSYEGDTIVFSNLPTIKCYDYDKNRNYILCGGIFPEYGIISDLEMIYHRLNEIKAFKQENENRMIIILSPRDIFIIVMSLIFSDNLKKLKNEFVKIEKHLESGDYDMESEKIESFDMFMKNIDKLEESDKQMYARLYLRKTLEFYGMYRQEDEFNVMVNNFLFCISYRDIKNKKIKRLFPKSYDGLFEDRHYIELLSFFYRKRELLKFILKNSHLFYQMDKYSFCTHSDISLKNDGYKDSILEFLKTKNVNERLSSYIKSFRKFKISGSNIFVVGDAKSECDTPIYKQTDESDIIYLNCSLGREDGKIFYETKKFKLQGAFKITNCHSEICFGHFLILKNRTVIEGVNAAEITYEGELSIETSISTINKIEIEGENFYPSNEVSLVYSSSKLSFWIRKEEDRERYLVSFTKKGSIPKSEKIIEDEIETVVSEKILKLLNSPTSFRKETFNIEIDGDADFEEDERQNNDNVSLSLSLILDENSAKSCNSAASMQSRKLRTIKEILESLDV